MDNIDVPMGVPDPVTLLNEFVAALPYKEREITKLHFGLGDGYRYSLLEIATIFKMQIKDMENFIVQIEDRLARQELLWIARRSNT